MSEGGEILISDAEARVGGKKDLERQEREPEAEKKSKKQVDLLLEQLRARFTDGKPTPPITVHDGKDLLKAVRDDREASRKVDDEYADEIEQEKTVENALKKIGDGEGEACDIEEIRHLFAYFRNKTDDWAHPVAGTDPKIAGKNQQVHEHIFADAVDKLPVPEAIVAEPPRYTFSDVDAVLAPLDKEISFDAIMNSYNIIKKDIEEELGKAEADPGNEKWVHLRDATAEARESLTGTKTRVVVVVLHPDGTREIKDYDAQKKYPPKLDGGTQQFILDFAGDGDYTRDVLEFTDLGKYMKEALKGITNLKAGDPINNEEYSGINAFLSRLENTTTGERREKVDQIGAFLRPAMINALSK